MCQEISRREKDRLDLGGMYDSELLEEFQSAFGVCCAPASTNRMETISTILDHRHGRERHYVQLAYFCDVCKVRTPHEWIENIKNEKDDVIWKAQCQVKDCGCITTVVNDNFDGPGHTDVSGL